MFESSVTTTTTIGRMTIVTIKEAENYGFGGMEGPVGFLYSLGGNRGGDVMGLLGYNELDKVWQFDTSLNDDGNTWQFQEADLHKAMKKAETIAVMMNAAFELHGDNLDFIGLLSQFEKAVY
jgi:hypothetical protein